VTSEALREARAACDRAFGFLVTEHGYRRDRRRFQWNGFLLRYRGPVVGVQVTWYPRDEIIVWLVRLAGGEFPERPWSIEPTTELRWFDLFDLAAIGGHQPRLTERERYALPDDRTAGLLADSLREDGADLLRGDLARLPVLERRIRDRSRALAVARFGAEVARSLGW
jgi:hypothetical protein